MPRYVILRQSHTDASAFEAVREALRQEHLWEERDGAIPEWEVLPHGGDQRDNFERAAAFMTEALEGQDSLTVLVDEVDAAKLNPLRSYGWSSLLAMLILAFPEMRWVFLVVTGKPKNAPENSDDDKFRNKIWQTVFHYHGTGRLQEDRGPPLFDGYGLRQAVLNQMERDDWRRQQERGGASEVAGIPQRPRLAVVLDDETGFSRFSALMAYIHGFRVHAISSWAEAEQLLGRDGWLMAPNPPEKGDVLSPSENIRRSESEAFLLTVEDLYVSFPDQSERGLSDLELRTNRLPGLEPQAVSALRRRFVTVGHERQGDRSAVEKRQRHLAELRSRETETTGTRLRKEQQLLHKPASGLYTLWDELGLRRAFPNYGEPGYCCGLAPGFCWPPRPPEPRRGNPDNANDGHSSPGRLLQIAEHLLDRASALIEDTNTLNESVHGAVLATQALELLDCRTPTLSLDALSLKHRFEVSAESHFVGVEYHPKIKRRLEDIELNLEALSHWFSKKRRKDFVLHGEAKILTQIIGILDAHGAFEEVEQCRDHLRRLHHQISHRAAWRDRKFLRILSRPFDLYMDWVLRSSAHFAGTTIISLVIFTWLFHLAGEGTALNSFYAAFRALFGEMAGWKDDDDKPITFYLVALNCTVAAFGLLNFGLLVSHLYAKIVRK